MGINMNDGFIEEVKAHNDIVEIISKYVELKKTGNNYKGLCPFHSEKTPSFIVSDDKQYFHCFGCGEAGDVIHFIMKMENLDFVDAVTQLGERVGIYPEKNSVSKQEKEEISRKNTIYEINRAAALFYYKNLCKKNNDGLSYLYKRKLNNKTVKTFGLGYAEDKWEALNSYLLEQGYDQSIIYAAGLVSERKKKNGYVDKFRNRIIFPIINTRGKVIGFGGRTIENNMPKYLNSPETPVFNKGENLFGLNFAKKEVGSKKQIIVVEGYMDVIALYQSGIKNVVASLGTALTKYQATLLKRYSEEVVIAYDGDTAGQLATLRGLDILREVGCQVKVLRLSEGKDPDEFIVENGKQAFLDEINHALPLVDYKILLAKNANDLTTVEGKINFVKSITEVLQQLKSPVERDAYIKKIAMDTQISIEAIKSEIYGNTRNNPQNLEKTMIPHTNKYRSKWDRHTNKYSIKPVKPADKLGYLEAERSLLKTMITDKTIFDKVKATMLPDDFIDETHKKIAKIMYRLHEQNNLIDMETIINALDIEEVVILHQINDKIIPMENIEKALIDYINTIQKHKLTSMKVKMEEELRKLEKIENKSQEQIVRIRELCINYDKLQKELKKL
ncbi:DNA primase [Clostridiaceae bacterium 35-E11]